MNTFESIQLRRSIRKFNDKEVSHEVLEEVIQAAIYSPSWKNTQITRYIAVEDKAIKEKIATQYAPSYNQNAIMSAPVLLALTVVKKRSGYERDGSYSTSKGSGWEMYDCGIATQTLCLAAQASGLGTVIQGIFDYDKVSELLQVPEEQEIVALIPMGYPDETPVMPKRKTVLDVLTII